MVLSFSYADSEDGCLGFTYGLLGKLQSNPDSIIELSDLSSIQTGDRIRINLYHPNESNFYLLYIGSLGEVRMLYEYEKLQHYDENIKQDSVSVTPLHWSPLLDPPGEEEFYFLNSPEALNELTKLVKRYNRAPDKGRQKISNSIRDIVNSLKPEIKGDLADIPTRLDKPMVGGVTFRGEGDKDLLKDMSLTHACICTVGICYKKIVLNHK